MNSWIAPSLLVLSVFARAQEPQTSSRPSAPPRVALVLAGGGPRGLAHLGVLRELEEQHVSIDLIVGSEWGALIGGLYAAGLSLDEIEKALLSADWYDALQDRIPRESLSFRGKQEDREYLLNLPLSIGGGGLILPPGLYLGGRMRIELALLTLGALGTKRFEDLPIAFLALATDLETGKPVTLHEGSLAQALEASMSTPVLRPPVRIGDRRLISGAISAPLPIDAALATGARTLIVVDLEEVAWKPERVSLLDVGARVFDTTGARAAEAARGKLRPQDIVLTPAIAGVDLVRYENAPQIVACGRDAAKALHARLDALASDPDAAAAWRRRQAARRRVLPTIDHVRIDPDCSLSASTIEARMETRAGEPLDPTRVRDDLLRIQGLRTFQRVDFDLEPTAPGHGDLVVHTEDLPTAPLHWRAGLTAELSAGNDINFVIGAGLRIAPTDSWGSETRIMAEAGNRVRFFVEHRQALEPTGRWFLAPYASSEKRPVQVESGQGYLTQFSVRTFELGLDLVRDLGSDWEARAGLLHRSGRSSLDANAAQQSSNQNDDFDENGFRLALTCDSLDDTAFPSRGSYLTTEWFRPVDDHAQESDETLRVHVDHALRIGAGSLVFGAEADTVLGGHANVQSFFPLGGFLRLSGLASEQISGPSAVLGRAVYLHPLQPRGFESRLVRFYGGASFELGNVFAEMGDIRVRGLIPAGSVFLGADTLLGPAYVGLGLAEEGERTLFLVLGKAF